ncbi:IclR family transcriptional regulator [Halogranum rubrum]|uniref:Transcriptional regulator, IclR family protein n=1 Tax=Halogranum salarium B-1 TaxID=1210908 RepID=J3JDE2_9EURY|nr:IclR family transcriptional regulator [Halogranum salarium]EJN57411.1 transcriptional regulator, IclR family protein [Halogranum salarium B-1]
MKSESDPVNTVEAVERAFSIIRALRELNGAGVTEIANYLGMSKSGTHKQLATLVKEGYITKFRGEYRLGFKFISDGEFVKNSSLFYNVGAPEIDKLAQKCKDCVYLAAMENDGAYCIYTAEGDNSVAADVKFGQRVSIHSTAAGKAILAELPESNRYRALQSGLEKKTEQTLTDLDQLESELATIRERGIAFEDEENVQGVRGVGSPILSPEDDVLGAVAISGPKSLLTDDRFEEELPELIRQTKNFIEVKFSLNSRDPHQDGSHVPEGFY